MLASLSVKMRSRQNSAPPHDARVLDSGSAVQVRAIRDYIAQDNPAAAQALAIRLLRRTRQLQVAPRSGRQVPEYRDATIRQLLERPYRIIYRITGDQIAILTVMHYR
jgi:toxin ParE1/3/4